MSNNLEKQLAGADAPANSKFPWAAVIEGAVTLASIGTNAWLQHRQNQTNQDMVDDTRRAELEQWQRENAYNTPSAQIARLKAAGLNPALIYGNGGIENTAATSPELESPIAAGRINIDPLTASQIAKNQAETEAIQHNTQREDEKQPITMEQLKSSLEESRQRVENLIQDLLNKKWDEQLKSMEYLRSSLDYQFQSTTFLDAVDQFKTTLSNMKKIGRQADFDYNRAVQYLSYEVVGWDLSNRRERMLLNIDYQTYRQTEELFQYIKQKAYWDSQNSYMDWRLKGKQEGKYNREIGLLDADISLKQLAFWIDARNNPVAFQRFARSNGMNENFLFNNSLGKFFMQYSDVWNHGLNLPIRLGIK